MAAAEKDGNPVAIGANPVTWTVLSSSITAPWWGDTVGRPRSSGAMNGLAWGTTPISLNGYETERTDMSGNGGTAPTTDTATLTDIVGSRQVVLRAEVTIGGETYVGTTTTPIDFGNGPLSVFAGAPQGSYNWANAATACGGTPGNPSSAIYQPATNLPTQAQLQAVAGSGSGGRQGAAHAAGWRDDTTGAGLFIYWTGEGNGNGLSARLARLDGAGAYWFSVSIDYPVAVCLP
jgi:hypothetical protein